MSERKIERTFDALPDTVDFRDIMYVPSLIEVPGNSDLDGYRNIGLPILNQGKEGACTGFALATVANYLLTLRGKAPLADEVSAAMFYIMAKRYDEWPGEDYEGSSARGAVKGWHKHGVCAGRLWEDSRTDRELTDERSADALNRPLGAYFRVNHRDLIAIHAAISEVGILYATARVHGGWMRVAEGDKEIVYSPELVGAHAFAIVGYDREGLWIQNSWGPDWGSGGLARLSYVDWLENGTDLWVAALGAPVSLGPAAASAAMRSGAPRSYEGEVYSELRPHIITSRNDGQLDDKGEYGLTPNALANLLGKQIPDKMTNWNCKRLLLYAHGGLVPQSTAVQHVANVKEPALDAEVYPLSFIWRSDAWSTLRNILEDAFSRRRDEGLLDRTKDFMLDRLDDTLEPLAWLLGGKAMWDEMKENATRATTRAGGAARLAAEQLVPLFQQGKIDELHLAGHSAGAVFMAPLADRLAESNITIASLSLWAPACTIELFQKIYLPLIEAGKIEAFDLYTLDDATERDDDCANIYHKSLLYLVSHAFERRPRIPFIQKGTPILGLERDVRALPATFWDDAARNWYLAPASAESNARHHGDFDNDGPTLRTTLRRITGVKPGIQETARAAIPSAQQRADQRKQLDGVLPRG